MRVVVTGCAGFIGSHLTESLLDEGHDVVGIDCMLPDLYDAHHKRANMAGFSAHPRFTFFEDDLRTMDLRYPLNNADVVINEAAMPGLQKSWSEFETYMSCNLGVVQRLADACIKAGVGKLTQISTSSVYGVTATADEAGPTRPFSPYGVTKLAAEDLLHAYHANFGLESVILRYFSVIGPRQRPDMAYRIFCESLLRNEPIVVYGDGRQSRTNTHVADVVRATTTAALTPTPRRIYNIAGAESIAVLDAIQVLADHLRRTPIIEFRPKRPGDQLQTVGVTTAARTDLNFVPLRGIRESLAEEADWVADSGSSRDS